MKNFYRKAFGFFFLVTLILTVSSLFYLCHRNAIWVKLIATAGLLSTVAGLFQLEVSGFFEKIMEEYRDGEKYPYGPPSHIVREIIDNPDTPAWTWLHNILFVRVRTGFWLIVAGTLVQVAPVWL